MDDTKKTTLLPPGRGVSHPIRALFAGWLFATALEFLLLSGESRDLSGTAGLAAMSFSRMLLMTIGIAITLTGLSFFADTKRWERLSLPLLFALPAGAAVTAAPSATSFLAGCALVLFLFAVYALFGWDGSPFPEPSPEKSKKRYVILTALAAGLFFAFLCVWNVGRLVTFGASTYDFGIFAQMFHHMKESGLPLTTVERDGLLSHFAVHVSPVWYLLLPFYCLFPAPAVLPVLQAAVMTSAVIPLWLLGKRHGFSGAERMLLVLLLLFFPAFSGGVGYDIHENCFLTPLLLWLFWAADRKSTGLTLLFALLTLSVKEDAAVYVAVFGLFLILKSLLRIKKRDFRTLAAGGALLALSVVWFILATRYLAESGDGVMTNRYANFFFGESKSLLTVVKAVLLSPLKLLWECTEPEKLRYIVLTLLPLLGLPFFTRRYERFLLLIPYVLLNLMSDYVYQHDIFFQYSFGSAAFLVYLVLLNLADLRDEKRRLLLLGTAVLVSGLCFFGVVYPKGAVFPQRAEQYSEYYENVREALDTIPDGVPVAATGYYVPHLSQRDVLYDVRYCSGEHLLSVDYIAIQLNMAADFKEYAAAGGDGLTNFTKMLKANGFELYESVPGVLEIYKKVHP